MLICKLSNNDTFPLGLEHREARLGTPENDNLSNRFDLVSVRCTLDSITRKVKDGDSYEGAKTDIFLEAESRATS